MFIPTTKQHPTPNKETVFLDPFGEHVGGTTHIGFYDGENWLSGADEQVIDYVSHWFYMPEYAGLVDELQDS